MRPLLAIARLTVKAAFRFRLIPALAILLVVAVVALPFVIRHNGTAEMFTQVLLTYTLSSITFLLGLATLWLACGTLARDVAECQMQMVAVKPVARWQIWLGKWLGVMLLNALLLGLSALAVFWLLHYQAQKLTPEQQQALRSEVLVARGGLREATPDFTTDVERLFQERMKGLAAENANPRIVREEIEEEVKLRGQLVPPRTFRRWTIDLGSRRAAREASSLQVRVKFHSADRAATELLPLSWQVGVPETGRVWRQEVRLAADSFNVFDIPAGLAGPDGRLVLECNNFTETTLLFPFSEDLEVLYPEGSFGLNFARGIGVIFCWLGLLAALGLATASFLSFPVASFLALALLSVVFSSSLIGEIVREGTVSGIDHETGRPISRAFDWIMVPLFHALLKVVNLAQDFSPIDALSSGRSVSWAQLGRAAGQVILLLGGSLSALGISLFTRRELATAQGNS